MYGIVLNLIHIRPNLYNCVYLDILTHVKLSISEFGHLVFAMCGMKQYGFHLVRHLPSRDSNSDRPDHSQLVTNDELDCSALGPGLIVPYLTLFTFIECVVLRSPFCPLNTGQLCPDILKQT